MMVNAASLSDAVKNANIEMVDSILAQDEQLIESTDERGCTPLRIAVEEGMEEMTAFLLELDANPSSKDSEGIAPLHIVRKPVIADMLLARNAEVNAKDNHGRTALHNAVNNGFREIIELLIECGANVNMRDKNGITPFETAKALNNAEIMEILKEAGAKD